MSGENVKRGTHVVVTVYTKEECAAPLVHVYGLKTRNQAVADRRAMVNKFAEEIMAGRLSVHACKVIDIDAMNEGLSS